MPLLGQLNYVATCNFVLQIPCNSKSRKRKQEEHGITYDIICIGGNSLVMSN